EVPLRRIEDEDQVVRTVQPVDPGEPRVQLDGRLVGQPQQRALRVAHGVADVSLGAARVDGDRADPLGRVLRSVLLIEGGPADALEGDWSPDGTQIAFISTRDGNPEVYVMNADGTGQTRITNNPADEERPDWHPFP